MPITDLSVFAPGQPFPPAEDKTRLERYEQNRKLFNGDHHDPEAFGTGSAILRPELKAAQAFVLNFHKRLTTHWADMVFSEPPALMVGTSAADEAMSEYVTDLKLLDAAREVLMDVSMLGDGVFKLRKRNDEWFVESQPPEYWFPVVKPNDVREVEAHVLAWEFTTPMDEPSGVSLRSLQTREQERRFIQIEIHVRGRVVSRVYRLDSGALGREVTDQFIPPEEQDVTYSSDEFLLVHVVGLRTSRELFGKDDYTDLDTLVMEMEDRLGQMSRILDKHADPVVYGPSSALVYDEASSRYVFKASSYIAIGDKDDPIPGYLTWDGELTSALNEFNLLFQQLLLQAETSPAAFGVFDNVPPIESGTALKRLFRTDLAKASRLKTAFASAFKNVLGVAGGLTGIEVPANFSFRFRDGLPDDQNENSQIAERGIVQGFMSRRTAVRMIHPEWTEEQVREELAAIEADQAASQDSAEPEIPEEEDTAVEPNPILAG